MSTRSGAAAGSAARKLILIVCAVLILVALAICIAAGIFYFKISPYADYDLIMPNVYCSGINLGGMTVDEAETAIENALEEPAYSVNVILPDQTVTFCPSQSGSVTNAAEIAQTAYAYMRQDTSAYGMYQAYQKALKTEYNLSASAAITYSQNDIRRQAQETAESCYTAATASVGSGDQASHTASVTPGTPGHSLDAAALADAVCSAFDSMDFSDITVQYDEVPIDLTVLQSACEDAVAEASSYPTSATVTADQEAHTITVTAGEPGYSGDAAALYEEAVSSLGSSSGSTVSITLNEVAPEAPDLTAAIDEINCDPTEPYYDSGEVVDGKNGYYIDYDSAEAQVSTLSYGETVTLTAETTSPELTAEDVEAVLFRDTLGSYSSPHTVNTARTTNLTLACAALNGTVINPGEEFSFNDTVGERTAEKGYQEGIVYVGTNSESQLGGGVCQVASTIYMAVLYADLEVTVRSPHIFFVTYVPGGLDATVYYGSQDFCFVNDTDYPIRIDASVSGGYVHISLVGTDVNHYTVELDSIQLDSTPYTTKTEYSSDYPAGYYEYISPYTGYTYQAYQYVYDENGNLVEKNDLGISEYEKRDATYLYGTG